MYPNNQRGMPADSTRGDCWIFKSNYVGVTNVADQLYQAGGLYPVAPPRIERKASLPLDHRDFQSLLNPGIVESLQCPFFEVSTWMAYNNQL